MYFLLFTGRRAYKGGGVRGVIGGQFTVLQINHVPEHAFDPYMRQHQRPQSLVE